MRELARFFGGLLFLFAALSPGIAYAQDMCRDVLKDGLRNNTSSMNQTAVFRAENAFYCSANASEAWSYYQQKMQNGQSAQGGVSYGPFSLSGGGGSNSSQEQQQAQFSSWKSNNCGSQSLTQQDQSFQYLAQSLVNGDTIAAWSKCMAAKQGLTCWTADKPQYVQLEINWTANSTDRPKIVGSFISGGRSAFATEGNAMLLAPDYPLNVGATGVPLIRDGRKPIGGLLNISHGGTSYSCSFYVPAIPEPTQAPTQANLDVRLLSHFSNIGCSANWPNQCSGTQPVSLRAGREVCKVVIAVKSGPTSSANFQDKITRKGGGIEYHAHATGGLFGPGQWVFLDADVYDIPSGTSDAVRKDAGCNR